MRAFVVESFDRQPVLRDVPPPVPAAGEVLIDIEACALNFADLLMAQGKYQERPPLPITLGMEIAGRVAATGDVVEALGVGDRILAFCSNGGLSEQVAIPADRCVALPSGMSAVEAAAFPIAYGTSHVALARRARQSSRRRAAPTNARLHERPAHSTWSTPIQRT
jgi:NADPH2:quinone reductase